MFPSYRLNPFQLSTGSGALPLQTQIQLEQDRVRVQNLETLVQTLSEQLTQMQSQIDTLQLGGSDETLRQDVDMLSERVTQLETNVPQVDQTLIDSIINDVSSLRTQTTLDISQLQLQVNGLYESVSEQLFAQFIQPLQLQLENKVDSELFIGRMGDAEQRINVLEITSGSGVDTSQFLTQGNLDLSLLDYVKKTTYNAKIGQIDGEIQLNIDEIQQLKQSVPQLQSSINYILDEAIPSEVALLNNKINIVNNKADVAMSAVGQPYWGAQTSIAQDIQSLNANKADKTDLAPIDQQITSVEQSVADTNQRLANLETEFVNTDSNITTTVEGLALANTRINNTYAAVQQTWNRLLETNVLANEWKQNRIQFPFEVTIGEVRSTIDSYQDFNIWFIQSMTYMPFGSDSDMVIKVDFRNEFANLVGDNYVVTLQLQSLAADGVYNDNDNNLSTLCVCWKKNTGFGIMLEETVAVTQNIRVMGVVHLTEYPYPINIINEPLLTI